MDEDLDSFAQQYAVRRNIKLGERLGFGIHGTVLAAQDDTKPGFFAVKLSAETAVPPVIPNTYPRAHKAARSNRESVATP
jgi:hypothetical protein